MGRRRTRWVDEAPGYMNRRGREIRANPEGNREQRRAAARLAKGKGKRAKAAGDG